MADWTAAHDADADAAEVAALSAKWRAFAKPTAAFSLAAVRADDSDDGDAPPAVFSLAALRDGADAAGAVRNDAGLATLGTASEARSLSARSLLDSGDAARHMPLLSGLLGLGMCDTPHTANLRGARRREKLLSLDGEALFMYSDGRVHVFRRAFEGTRIQL